jgi:hypothetical protein
MSNSCSAGRLFSPEDFNFNIFHGLSDEFKDLVTSLMTKVEPFLYTDLHSHLFTHDFLHKNSLQSLATNPPLLPSVHLAQQQHNPNFSLTEIILATISAPTATGTTTNIGLIFMVLIPLLPRTRSRVISSRPNGLLVLDNGLLTGYLSRTSSVSHASPSATQPHNMLRFVVAVTSPLPILILVLFLPLLSSRKLV